MRRVMTALTGLAVIVTVMLLTLIWRHVSMLQDASDPPITSTSEKCQEGKGTRPLLDNSSTKAPVSFSYYVKNTGKCPITVTGVDNAPVIIEPEYEARKQFTAQAERVVRVTCLPKEGVDLCKFSFERYKTP